MKLFTLVTLGTLVFALPAYASVDCDLLEDQATMAQCTYDKLVQVDKQLNDNYKKIEKRLADDDESKKLLLISQRAWIKFRDAECNFSTSGTAGGSIHSMMLTLCRTQLTSDRNKQLLEYLNCEEGDLSCSVPPED